MSLSSKPLSFPNGRNSIGKMWLSLWKMHAAPKNGSLEIVHLPKGKEPQPCAVYSAVEKCILIKSSACWTLRHLQATAVFTLFFRNKERETISTNDTGFVGSGCWMLRADLVPKFNKTWAVYFLVGWMRRLVVWQCGQFDCVLPSSLRKAYNSAR